MIHKVTSSVKRAKRRIKNESARAVLVFLISLMLVSQVSFAETDLFSAAGSGNLSQVKSLVEKGADVNHAHRMKFRLCGIRGHLEIAKYLMKGATTSRKIVPPWATRRPPEIAKYLVERGAT